MKNNREISSSWAEDNQSLTKTFVFLSFEEAMRFMYGAVAFISEHDHHPTWTNTYNKIEVKLCTHDVGNRVTEKDRVLAKYLDELFIEFN